MSTMLSMYRRKLAKYSFLSTGVSDSAMIPIILLIASSVFANISSRDAFVGKRRVDDRFFLFDAKNDLDI